MAAVVWLYHGWLLQGDRRVLEEEQDQRAAEKKIVVVGGGKLAQSLVESLQAEFPESTITAVSPAGENIAEVVAAADILIGPWTIVTTAGDLGAALSDSPAQKLILPSPAPGWQWVTEEAWDSKTAVRTATQAIEKIVAGETAVPDYAFTPGTILLLIAATILILILLTSLLGTVLPIFG